MKSELCRVALGFMLLELYGCGLKGPLYFPTADKIEQDNQLTTTLLSTQSLGCRPPRQGDNSSTKHLHQD
ncbi:MAG: LPS translocon maturation chaperone LptM [Sodalis sp. (in: enterobacteria)]